MALPFRHSFAFGLLKNRLLSRWGSQKVLPGTRLSLFCHRSYRLNASELSCEIIVVEGLANLASRTYRCHSSIAI